MRDLSKKKLGQFSKALEVTQAAFRAEVEKLAEEARTEILPYFRKNNFDYRAGNGNWLITRPTRSRITPVFVNDDDLPENIRSVLLLEVAHADHLGFYVRDIKRGEW